MGDERTAAAEQRVAAEQHDIAVAFEHIRDRIRSMTGREDDLDVIEDPPVDERNTLCAAPDARADACLGQQLDEPRRAAFVIVVMMREQDVDVTHAAHRVDECTDVPVLVRPRVDDERALAAVGNAVSSRDDIAVRATQRHCARVVAAHVKHARGQWMRGRLVGHGRCSLRG